MMRYISVCLHRKRLCEPQGLAGTSGYQWEWTGKSYAHEITTSARGQHGYGEPKARPESGHTAVQ